MLWWKQLRLKMGTTEDRIQALRQIAASGNPQALDVLIEALKDRDGQVPLVAAEILGILGDARAVPALVAALRDKEDYIRWAAAQALGKLGLPAVEPLLTALRDPDPALRELAAKTLGQLGSVALGPLVDMLSRSPQKLMRDAAAEALGKINHDRAIHALVAALGDREDSVREKAARSLVNIGKTAVPALLAVLNHANPEIRKRALWALERLGSEPMDEAYVRPVAHGKWKDVGSLNSPALEALATALQDRNRDARLTAVKALANIGDVRAVPGLTLALDDADRDIRDMATKALVKIGAGAVDHLLAVLQKGESGQRAKAIQVLGYIGNERTLKPLLTALADPDAELRGNAAEALASFKKEPAAVDALIRALADSSAQVRFNAAGSLWRLGDPKAAQPLLPLLRDPDHATRARAAQVLGDLGDDQVIDPLLELFRTDPASRLEAALAVGKVRAARAAQPLLTLAVEDPDSASEALEILADVLEVAGKELTPAELRAMADLPHKLAADRPAPDHANALRTSSDPSKVVKLANAELSRRGLLADPKTKPAAARKFAPEARSSPRMPVQTSEVFLLQGMHQPEPDRARVLDVSDGGLGLLAKKSFSAGTVLSMRPVKAGEAVAWSLVEVRQCEPLAGGWQLGCKFVQNPTADFLAFLK